jgi:hypothetical protein
MSVGKVMKPVKLFVAGLPTKVGLDQVLRYFWEFADVALAPESISGQQGVDDTVNSGHCIIQCWNYVDAEYLTQIRHFDFMGRTLTVQYNKTGVGLIIENRRLNKSRLILKQVPTYVEEDMLKAEIEQNFGPVMTLYMYKKNHPYLQDQSRVWSKQYVTYSVVMKTPNLARMIYKQGNILLCDGSEITVEKYSKKKVSQKTRNEELTYWPELENRKNQISSFSKNRYSKITGEKHFTQSPVFTGFIPVNHLHKPTTNAYRVPALQHSSISAKYLNNKPSNILFRIGLVNLSDT